MAKQDAAKDLWEYTAISASDLDGETAFTEESAELLAVGEGRRNNAIG